MAQTPDAQLRQVFPDAPEDLMAVIRNGLLHYAKEVERGGKMEGVAERLRNIYQLGSQFLLERAPEGLNLQQRVFLDTGAIGSTVTLPDESGQVKKIELLPEDFYQGLCRSVERAQNLPPWADKILLVEDKWKLIALGDLEPMQADGQVARGRRSKTMDASKAQAKRVQESQSLYQAVQEQFAAVEPEFKSLMQTLSVKNLHPFLMQFDTLSRLLGLLAQDPRQARELIKKEPLDLGRLTAFLSEAQAEMGQLLKKLKPLQQNVDRLVAVEAQMSGLEGTQTSVRKKEVIFSREALRKIKWDQEGIAPFIIRSAQASRQRHPLSDARLVVKEVLNMKETDVVCTVQQVMASIRKLCGLHVNLFPADAQNNPVLPPFVIEPGYDYVEWFEDRMVLSFIPAQVARKGPKVSFSPVDMLLLRAFGLYLAKDPIYDYRGDRNLGTFMGEYAGEVQKKAAVKWVGEQKKATMVTDTKVLDEAGRDDAVEDYCQFLFAMVNDFPPPAKISQRKVGVLLKYVCVQSPVKSAALAIRYVGLQDPFTCRDILLQYTNRQSREARRLAEEAFKESAVIRKYFQNSLDMMIQRIFGKE